MNLTTAHNPSSVHGSHRARLSTVSLFFTVALACLALVPTQVRAAYLLGASSWVVSHTTDLVGDGKADLVWRHTDGWIAMWLMDGVMQGGDGTAAIGGDVDGGAVNLIGRNLAARA